MTQVGASEFYFYKNQFICLSVRIVNNMSNETALIKTFLFQPTLWLAYGIFFLGATIDILILYVCIYTMGFEGIIAFLIIATIIAIIKKKSSLSIFLKNAEDRSENIFNSPIPQIRYGAYLFHVIFLGTLGFGPNIVLALSAFHSALDKSFSLGLFSNPSIFGIAILAGFAFGILTLGAKLFTYKLEKKKKENAP